MKWIALLVLSVWLTGCATPKPMKHHRHRSTPKHEMSIADDAATKALIKSLRE